jgi:hypothetical protein
MEPKSPDYKGLLQTRVEHAAEKPVRITYETKGEIALWNHSTKRFVLKGYVNIDGKRYLVSLEQNGQ